MFLKAKAASKNACKKINFVFFGQRNILMQKLRSERLHFVYRGLTYRDRLIYQIEYTNLMEWGKNNICTSVSKGDGELRATSTVKPG